MKNKNDVDILDDVNGLSGYVKKQFMGEYQIKGTSYESS